MKNMTEYNGWIIVRESDKEEGEDQKLLYEVVEKINEKIQSIQTINDRFIMENLNGEFHLAIMASHNHYTPYISDLFKWIASISKGSYGLLYLHDDESLDSSRREGYEVLRMCGGQVDSHEDPFLSPRFPTLEE